MAVDLSLLPPRLREHAVFLCGETAWPRAVALDVAEALRRGRIAILGVEVWLDEEDAPKVWGWSRYEATNRGDWDTFVEENFALALAELQRDVPSEALWHFTILSEGERVSIV